jgi:hypothetical protein
VRCGIGDHDAARHQTHETDRSTPVRHGTLSFAPRS